MAKHRVFTEKEIARARETDMLSYLEGKGEQFKKQGNYYRHTTHDSMVICPSKGYYVWNSMGGKERQDRSCIDLAQAFYNLTFAEAVGDILEHQSMTHSEENLHKNQISRKFNYKHDIVEIGDTRALKTYLINERKLNPWLVSELLEKGYLAQDNRRNIIFKWHDPIHKDQIVGASLQGTTLIPEEKRLRPDREYFKQVIVTGHNGFYFDVGQTKNINKLFVFESSIDLLSFLSLKIDEVSPSLRNARLLAMEGLKPATFFNNYSLLEKSLNRPIEAHICVDNDRGGHEFLNTLMGYDFKKQGRNYLFNDITFDYVIPTAYKGLYQKVANKLKIDWRDIAAFHKVETNFSPEGILATKEEYNQFFDPNINSDIEKAVVKCALNLKENITFKNAVSVREVLKSRYPDSKDISTLLSIEHQIESYSEQYKVGNYEFTENIPKDWNELLVGKELKKKYQKEPAPMVANDEYLEQQYKVNRVQNLEREVEYGD